MPPKSVKTLLLIELLDTDPPYNTAEVLKAIVGKQGNERLNVVGKKVICTFANQDVAAENACELMEINFPGKKPGQPFVRMCVCQMPDGMGGKDAQTQAVSVAARELAKAKAGQIVTTQDTAGNLSAKFEVKFGTSEVIAGVRLFEIIPPAPVQEEMTRIASLSDRAGKKLRLLWRNRDQAKKEMVLYNDCPMVNFGREEGNDIIIENEMASRRHGYLEYRQGNIYIVDNSTNGTYVFPEMGAKFKVHKGEQTLPPRGYLCLGEELDASSPLTIHFVTVFSAS